MLQMSDSSNANNITPVEIEPPIVTPEEPSTTEMIRSKIIHILKIYPTLSHSMLQIGLGSSLPAVIWRPILLDMIQERAVIEDHLFQQTPSGRNQTYTLLSLNPKLK